MQLKVIKADGNKEEYLHTKVIATFSNALGCDFADNMFISTQLAEAVTFFLYHSVGRSTVTSSEIFSMIQVVLTSTGFMQAALVLSEHHCRRNLSRNRIEVINMDLNNFADIRKLTHFKQARLSSGWNKSIIIDKLINKYQIERGIARAIASAAEERIINMQLSCISHSLIKQIVLTEAATILNAAEQLRQETGTTLTISDHADKDVCPRQRQKGLCTIEV